MLPAVRKVLSQRRAFAFLKTQSKVLALAVLASRDRVSCAMAPAATMQGDRMVFADGETLVWRHRNTFLEFFTKDPGELEEAGSCQHRLTLHLFLMCFVPVRCPARCFQCS